MVKITVENITKIEYQQILEQEVLPNFETPILLEDKQVKIVNLTSSSVNFGDEQCWTFVIEALIGLSTKIAAGIISSFVIDKIKMIKQKKNSAKIKLNGQDITNSNEKEIITKVEKNLDE